MQLSAALCIIPEMARAVRLALLPTLRDVWQDPTLLIRVSRIFMAYVWTGFADATDEGGKPVKEGLITPNAHGVVLELGAGHGHTVNYLDHSRVKTYVALEPNALMHPLIRQKANDAGYTESDGSLIILSCSAEDVTSILKLVDRGSHPVDTIISILTLCTIPAPEQTMQKLVRDVLRPGGQVLFYEHVLSPRHDVAWWQRFWAPIWEVLFDGCRLDRPSHVWIGGLQDIDVGETGNKLSVWKGGQSWGKPGESAENLWWHQAGRYVKKE
ncbi:phospholipid methyltransferase [Moniliophthora roreri]|uniref:Phospholipid methyltransferase n=1 Tax=Moniliophthora roreri TaxID=221103 RepID=A0A0W0FSI6_MONRR|nr:phospholipid methyltransferase [Moniliophthora roreri]